MRSLWTDTDQPTAMYYDQDTQPIEGGTLAWAELFEDSRGRIIGQCKTLYGEKLSTVWLGIDHQFGDGLPLIFETMLFAPRGESGSFWSRMESAQNEAEQQYIKKHYPHDQLQLRYTWKDDARESFEKLRLQCLVPPRWRRFIFYTIGKDATWS